MNANGTFDGNDVGQHYQTVYIDDDDDLVLDSDEKWTVTNHQGEFFMSDVSLGEHRLRWTLGIEQISPLTLAPDYYGLKISVPPDAAGPTNLELAADPVTDAECTVIRTYAFNDTNRDGVRQSTEPVLSGFMYGPGFIDHNANGVDDGIAVDEPLAESPRGQNMMPLNRYAVYAKTLSGYTLTTPAKQIIPILQAGQNLWLNVGMVVLPTSVLSVAQNINDAVGTLDVQFDRSLYSGGGGINAIEFRNSAGQLISWGRQALPTANAYRFRSPANIPDGVYTMRIPGAVLAGTATPPPDYVHTFNVLRNDLDLDGTIDFDDLLILAQHFMQSGTYSQGNLTRDVSGRIDFDDLLLLSQSFGRTVVPALSTIGKRNGRSISELVEI